MAKRRTSTATIVIRRTYSIFRHQRERAKEAGVDLTYSVEDIRQKVKPAIGQPCP